jgi:hypothetical protein
LKHPPYLDPVVPCEQPQKVANMSSYHRQARILGATRRHVNGNSRAVLRALCTLHGRIAASPKLLPHSQLD